MDLEQQGPGEQNNSGDEPDGEEGDGEEIPRTSTVDATPVRLRVASWMPMDPRGELNCDAGCDDEANEEYNDHRRALLPADDGSPG